jgi:S-adenosylmethionine:tRNA-ribosyltransferase-isomerase (queuine synthetase)
MEVKTIFNNISGLMRSQTVSSIGNFVSHNDEIIIEATIREIIPFIAEDSIAMKIILGNKKANFSEKQVWAIAYELLKSNEYCDKLTVSENERKTQTTRKAEAEKSKLAANKEASSEVLDFVKSNGKKLGDYYLFLKTTKTFQKEFYSKKYTMNSANEFISK